MPKKRNRKNSIEIVKGKSPGWESTIVDAGAYRRYHERNPGSLATHVFISKSIASSGEKLSRLNETLKDRIINSRQSRTDRE